MPRVLILLISVFFVFGFAIDLKDKTILNNENYSLLDSACIEKGKRLFNENCSACHDLENKTVGPALGKISKRRELDWLFTYVQNSDELFNRGDGIALMLRSQYPNFTTHTKFSFLTKDEIFCILKFLSPEDDSLDAKYDKLKLEEDSKIEIEEKQLHQYADSLEVVITEEYKLNEFNKLEECNYTFGSNCDYDDPANFDCEQHELTFYESGAKNILKNTTSGWDYSENKTYYFYNKKLIAVYTKIAHHVGEDISKKYVYNGQASIVHSYTETYGQEEDISGYTNIQQNLDKERNFEEYKSDLKGTNYKCF